ncbi:MAG: hypothetical protein P9G45_04660 [Candidatus Contendobacter sp.]|nr:hypothetical protein [Candidatus Contendobacter sp.]
MVELWQTAFGIAGIGSIAAFVFWSLYKEWLKLPIFQQMTKEQQFRLFILFIVFAFIFALAGLGTYAYIATLRTGELNITQKNNNNKTPTALLNFVSVQKEQSESYQEETSSSEFELSPFKTECDKYLQIDKIVSNADIGFDVTLLNTSSQPLILTEIGFKVIKVTEINVMPLGEWKAFEIEKKNKYVINVPDIYGEIGKNLDYAINDQLLSYLSKAGISEESLKKLKGKEWRSEVLRLKKIPEDTISKYMSSLAAKYPDRYRGFDSYNFIDYIAYVLGEEASKITEKDILLHASNIVNIERVIKEDIKNPIYLEKEAPFRFSIILKDYAKNMPNISEIQLYAGTDKGTALSKSICIAYMVVREDRITLPM